MRILVIGASGLLGGAVTHALIDAGHVVTMLAREDLERGKILNGVR